MLELFNFSLWPTIVSIPRPQGRFSPALEVGSNPKPRKSALETRLTVSVKVVLDNIYS